MATQKRSMAQRSKQQPAPTEVGRLAFVRLLLEKSLDEAQRPPPYVYGAILSLHDAVELFMQIATEHYGKKKNDHAFKSYWTILGSCAPVVKVYESAMDRLNKARVDLKHYGNLPAPEQVKQFADHVSLFLDEAAAEIFGLQLADISPVCFVTIESVKGPLAKAQACLGPATSRTASSTQGSRCSWPSMNRTSGTAGRSSAFTTQWAWPWMPCRHGWSWRSDPSRPEKKRPLLLSA